MTTHGADGHLSQVGLTHHVHRIYAESLKHGLDCDCAGGAYWTLTVQDGCAGGTDCSLLLAQRCRQSFCADANFFISHDPCKPKQEN